MLSIQSDDDMFSNDNLLSIDQRGFKTLIQQEADEFLTVQQRVLNATVHTVAHSRDGVTITLGNGTKLSAEYALCTFSLGVLQNDDVHFQPPLPRKYRLLSPCSLHHSDYHQNSSKKLSRGWQWPHTPKYFSDSPTNFGFQRRYANILYYLSRNVDISPLRWQFMLTLNVVGILSGKAWTIQISFRDQE